MSDSEGLRTDLENLYRVLRAEKRKDWDRDLPLQELLTDRWERARNLGFGEGASVYQSAYVMWDVQVGRHTWIGPNVLLDGRAPVRIGDYCSISTGVQIYTHDTVRWALTGGRAEMDKAPVTIGDRCYIGAGAIILKGVTIGEESVVGAMSLVNRNLPPRSVAFGVPARIRGRVCFTPEGEPRIELDGEGASCNASRS